MGEGNLHVISNQVVAYMVATHLGAYPLLKISFSISLWLLKLTTTLKESKMKSFLKISLASLLLTISAASFAGQGKVICETDYTAEDALYELNPKLEEAHRAGFKKVVSMTTNVSKLVTICVLVEAE